MNPIGCSRVYLRKVKTITLWAFITGSATVIGGIPEPPSIRFGSLRIDGRLITATETENVVVVARVSGASQPVGQYVMGANQGASGQCQGSADCYVLQIKLESGADGSPQSADAARVGQIIRVYVKEETGPELFAGSFAAERGSVAVLNLDVETVVDIDGDGDSDLADYARFQTCFTGVSQGTLPAGCTSANTDSDADVDLNDYAAFPGRLSGPS